MQILALALVGHGLNVVSALPNGLGGTPAMGYSSWNDCSSFRDNGPNGWCWDSEAHIKNVTSYMLSSGLAALGYRTVNVDEGWLKGRNAQGQMYEDLDKFPSGMKGLGDWITAQAIPGANDFMRYGLYSCRGTCQCGTGSYNAPGSHGYEKADTDFMVAAGATYIKIDSCCGDQDHATAFSDYGKWRDAMNQTGNRVWFSLCGWEEWYAPPDPSLNYTGGTSLGNSWRIAGDGSGWGPLTNCMNTIAAVSNFSGPGGWSDPDLLIGPQVYVGGQTDEQARAQFSMWSLFPANLLISQNVLAWTDYALETYSNAELIAVNQDSLGSPAFRIAGKDLKFPCGASGGLAEVTAAACDAKNPGQTWSYDASSGYISSTLYAAQSGVLDVAECATADGSVVALYPADNGAGECVGRNQNWTKNADGTFVNGNSKTVLDVFNFVGPLVDVYSSNGGANQIWALDGDGTLHTKDGGAGRPPMCLLASASSPATCTNVWGRALSGGAFALGFVNNGGTPTSVTCDATCFAALNIPSSVTSLVVRDLWAHATVATLSPPFAFTATIDGNGFAGVFKLTPA